MGNILQVSSLTKSYATFALNNVTFSLEEGSIVGFMGANGAGKITTIKSILNIVEPDSGKIVFMVEPLRKAEPI